MRNIFYTIFFIFYILNCAKAQTSIDIFRFSYTQYIGTARALGTNTTMSGIGSDFTSVLTNPAGIGQYRKSEIMFSNGLSSVGVNSAVQNENKFGLKQNERLRYIVPNIGLIVTMNEPNAKYRNTIAIGYNTLNHFSQNFEFFTRSSGSIVERFAANAQGFTPNELDLYESDLAYKTYLIDTINSETEYFYDYDGHENVKLDKGQYVTQKGRMHEFDIAYGGNFNDVVSFGIGLGIPILKFSENKQYKEHDFQDDVPFFNDLTFNEQKSIKGGGINGKFGVMLTPFRGFNIGASVISPTFMELTEDFNTSLDFNAKNEDGTFNSFESSPDGIIVYGVTIPVKYSSSIGLIIGKYFFFNGELLYTNFSKAKINIDSNNSFDKETEDYVNNQIKGNYQGSFGINVGGEVVIARFKNTSIQIRGGFGQRQSGYTHTDKFFKSWSVGTGFRHKSFFIDFAFNNSETFGSYFPYALKNANLIQVNQEINRKIIQVTCGFKLD